MNWKLKALIQNFVDKLPLGLSYPVYYKIQRNLGGLKKIDPYRHFKNSIFIINAIKKQNCQIVDKTFLEIGTGRTLNIPIALWLCGASRIITVDLNPYLRKELIIESIEWIRQHKNDVRFIFRDFTETSLFNNRLDDLSSSNDDLNKLLNLMNIEYFAPADASCLQIEDNIIDFHFSVTVLEHISLNVIRSILSEARRVLSVDGLVIHLIDLSDHFSHSDQSITSINFLKFSEKQAKKWLGNKFMYHNRLRAYEFYELFKQQYMEILFKEETIDNKALELIKNGFPLDNRFIGHAPEELAISNISIIGRPLKERK